MGYTEQHKAIKSAFRSAETGGILAGTGIRVVKETFHSHCCDALPETPVMPGVFNGFFSSDGITDTNNNFTYYVFLPERAMKGVIILLHGLNERSWDKYLPWAVRLAEDTGKPVILFPIAYHMNRSPGKWTDRHEMMKAVTSRLLFEPATKLTTFVNVALSIRMSVMPQRFFLSGFQAVNDVAILIRGIKNGRYSYLSSEGPSDIFAYSIGVMLSQVLMLSRGGLLPDDSRLMLFSGGSVLNRMNGASKMIMDSKAFDRLIGFYIDEVGEKVKGGGDYFSRMLEQTAVGEAFYAMSSQKRLKEVYGKPYAHLDGKVKAISFTGDLVIPPVAISDTMTGSDVEIWSPDYPFTHENPFPVLVGEMSEKVDFTFDSLFARAASFLA